MQYIAFDIETTGLSPYNGAEIFSFATADEEGKCEVGFFPSSRKKLNALLLDNSMGKVCHNLKFELSFLHAHGYLIAGNTEWHDTMIMSQLLNNTAPSHGLDALAEYYCDYPTDIDREVAAIASVTGNYSKVPRKLMEEYQRRDVERTMILFKLFYPKILANKKLHADYLNEIELIKVTRKMEEHGILLHKENCAAMIEELTIKAQDAEDRLGQLTGEYFNPGSAKDMRRLFYSKLKFPVLGVTKKGGEPSVDKNVIAALKEKYPDSKELDCVLAYRSYSHGVSTIQGYLEVANSAGIIHPNIKTNFARTGREASENPNLQNISKEGVLNNPYAVNARRCFRARPGYFLLLVDYAGIEMRLIIEATQEPELLELVRHNGDPHRLAAEIFYGEKYTDRIQAIAFVLGFNPKMKKDYSRLAVSEGKEKVREWAWPKVQKILRTAAKNAQFAKAYGAGLGKVAATLKIPIPQAAPGYYAYCKRFPRVAEFTGTIAREIAERGSVVTPFGRELKINPEKAYSGSNYYIQGMAAGILKRAQVAIDKYIYEFWTKYGIETALLLPVHDELIFEYPKSEYKRLQEFVDGVRERMITMPEITVPLEVEWKISPDIWAGAVELARYKHAGSKIRRV